MVVGAAMLLAGHSAATGAGLGIPKSPSFHSGLELAAAAKDINFQDYKTVSSNSNYDNHNICDYSPSDESANKPIACVAVRSTAASNLNPFATEIGDYSGTATMPSFTNLLAKV